MYYVYVLCNEEGQLYIGFTSDLRRRIEKHNAGHGCTTRGSKWEVVYYEAYKAKSDAWSREQALKGSTQARRWLMKRIKNSMPSR